MQNLRGGPSGQSSEFFGKLDRSKIALEGHSIGSANSFLVGPDPRLTTTIHVAGGSLDMAGDITKRHSATRLEFARFGGACPLWIVHEAVAIPDRILVQLAETPDGVRYVSMAKGLVKPSGRYDRAPRRYAVALGCETVHAGDFVYADGLDLAGTGATPIGVSCRICPRADCDQRAFPPAMLGIHIDPDRRDVVPYRVG